MKIEKENLEMWNEVVHLENKKKDLLERYNLAIQNGHDFYEDFMLDLESEINDLENKIINIELEISGDIFQI